jgi:ERCC4-related helicase
MSESLKSKNSPLNVESIEVRKYQKSIANKCVNKNSLVVLPTGLGKTIIAVLVAAEIIKVTPPHSKIIILAPTRPLINQHYFTFLKALKIPENLFFVLTGRISPEKRDNLFKENRILFYTPQTLRNDLVQQKYTLRNVSLIVFDEAHHASGDYPYTLIADTYIDQNPDGTILALTASPGFSKEKITQLCSNLHIPVENIHIRTRKDTDVKVYLKPMDVYKMGVDLTTLMEDALSILLVILEERLQFLSQLNFLSIKSEELYKKVIRKDLLNLNKELTKALKENGDKTGIYSALSVNAQALIISHMIELVEQQGLDILLDYLEQLYQDVKKKNGSKAIKILASDHRLRNLYLELKKNQEFLPQNLTHPKYNLLVNILLEQITENKNSRILIFIKLRNSVKKITKKLKKIPDLRAKRFVGQATKSEGDKGLSQKEQINILKSFKEGKYNILCSTNIGEEGLDVAECDLVIFYDVVASEIRLIQRKGRTARHHQGKVIILYTKKTHDELYLQIALTKLKKMNINLQSPETLAKSRKVSHNKYIESESYICGKKAQLRLDNFIPGIHKINEKQKISDLKVSQNFPMKFGLRKRLQQENIDYEIVDSDLHIVLYNKVLIQIWDPKSISFDQYLVQTQDLLEISELLISIFDFIDFKEQLEGEKHVLKQKLRELASNHDLRIINIDNLEEFYFIFKNLYQSLKAQGKKNG